MRRLSRRCRRRHFNPRAPRGARPHAGQDRKPAGRISIHVPREGHDGAAGSGTRTAKSFQSTCPARGTTGITRESWTTPTISIHVPREGHDGSCGGHLSTYYCISIHVPREGHDPFNAPRFRQFRYFNPRAPRGARQPSIAASAFAMAFQSTCPARGTTSADLRNAFEFFISIHVPREGHDI